MPDNTTEYREKLTEIMQVPAPDDLIHGWYTAAKILLTGPAELKRGTLMMTSGGNVFAPATSAGLSSAEELCILCDDAEIPEGESGVSNGYFSGEFLGTMVILPYETEADNHSELIETIKPTLRKHRLLVK